ncbi:Eco57I restriction-modification methylase domain-containing protein [Streptomyces sp. NPDC051561]|uniref:Eco57I restriction-modification methylase domain-containing protein n=1 Tax=Streptomyces sp. NPDC051561 TaxID=3365658 RepID=UPI00379AE576
MGTGTRHAPTTHRRAQPDGRTQHREWLGLVTVDGPLPDMETLHGVWPQLDALDRPMRDGLRLAHREWQEAVVREHRPWIDFVLGDLLGWGDALRSDAESLAALASSALGGSDHQEPLTPSFILVPPDGTAAEPALLGLVCPPDTVPTSRVPGSATVATPVDRLAVLCRSHGVPLGLATSGRWWTLVHAPRQKPTTTVTFDSADWPARAERTAVRAFVSLLHRRRFFAVPDDETLAALLTGVKDQSQQITDSLGRQVQQAVSLLVSAIGRLDADQRAAGGEGLGRTDASEVYQAALATQMRILFAFFAEEQGLLPADNPVYAQGYSAGGLCADLEQRARDTSEEDLEHSTAAWHRLVALFHAVYAGVEHAALKIGGYDGSLFRPDKYVWLEGDETRGLGPLPIDDRTVLHMLRAVQFVKLGRGRSAEVRKLTFRDLSIAQIGHVYEGLLAYEGYRAAEPMVGLVGKEGLEQQVPLRELERLAAESVGGQGPANSGLAAALHKAYGQSGIGTAKKLEGLLAPPPEAGRGEVRRQLLSATGGDAQLTERLLPFHGLIRVDLRGLPVVVPAGGLHLAASSQRKATGAHYTPEFLAAEVVEHALSPLVYSPGPLDTPDKDAWRLRTSAEILRLKVADIACGSGAFLVAACRYLAERLVEAWAIEGDEASRDRIQSQLDTDSLGLARPETHDLFMIRARRKIAENCLYGVDINPLAVELAKFALWLDTVEPGMPFTFLDDRIMAGDSLLGITSYEQIEAMHLVPAAGRALHAKSPVDFTSAVPFLTGLGAGVQEAGRLRDRILGIPGRTLADLGKKRRLLEEAKAATELPSLFGDLIVGASLAHLHRGKVELDRASIAAADTPRLMARAAPGAVPELARRARGRVDEWLRAALKEYGDESPCFHWPLRFPEVFRAGGFDAVVGNPPFLGGQKITGTTGTPYREFLVTCIGGGVRGSADLVAYFMLRTNDLLNRHGHMGLIATDTVAEGDTREVGLDQIVARGGTIHRATESALWPLKGAQLKYRVVWAGHAPLGADGAHLTSSLTPESRVAGKPHRLAENRGLAFQGSTILGLGFTMQPEAAQALVAKDSRYEKVLFPYLNGQDLNSRPGGAASRWVINFHDWSKERAKLYPEVYEQVLLTVKPERDTNKRKVYRDFWWQFGEKRPSMVKAIEGLDRLITIALVSKVAMPMMVPNNQVFSHMLGVFATDDFAMLGLLSSAPHYWWSISRASSLKGDLRYTPSDVFATFPRPAPTGELRALGDHLDSCRRELMRTRNAGLTATYNLVHSPACQGPDIVELRAIHRSIDEEVVRAYGWHDLLGRLDHGFHDTRQGVRHTIGPVVRQEILDRLLELNFSRYEEENPALFHPSHLSLDET